MSHIRVSAFRWVPPFAQGLVREFRVRWALEEAGLAYEELLIGPEDQTTDEIDLFHAGEEWAKQRRPAAVEEVRRRLTDLARWMEGPNHLEDRFTAADLLMTTVLNILRHTPLVAEQPVLEAYRVRCAARPAYQKAMADHLAPFARNAPPGT
ncbi:glutathione binding-like protein [Cystobacter ferrugineus]|uniref:Glutathione S-transferase C-terminal domain-containing protein n=1 Tax=Cystobacter ferrugineus TaxID=83449 RepID=A0A1L9BAA5_9BACT|nr:glutathione binding-like protein [Cystobacter ferrugineus]OJH39123.1 hypothetical protein BON30_16380 [Cystobacter ferrugineus]